MTYLQEEVVRVAGEKALELGLLFGTENLTPQEEETDVFCFAHLMLQEFVAAIFIAGQDKVVLQHLPLNTLANYTIKNIKYAIPAALIFERNSL